MKFAADAMLGRLAKWLRLMGFDVVFIRDVEDSELVRLARQEGRLVLTRDRRLAESLADGEALIIEDNRVKEQLLQIIKDLKIPPASFNPLSRCAVCNETLRDAAKDDVRDRVPEFVISREEFFRICPSCGRVYWPGTHARRITKIIRSLKINAKPCGSEFKKDQRD